MMRSPRGLRPRRECSTLSRVVRGMPCVRASQPPHCLSLEVQNVTSSWRRYAQAMGVSPQQSRPCTDPYAAITVEVMQIQLGIRDRKSVV